MIYLSEFMLKIICLCYAHEIINAFIRQNLKLPNFYDQKIFKISLIKLPTSENDHYKSPSFL